MKTRISIFVICAAALVSVFMQRAPLEELPIGAQIPMADQQLKDVSGKTVTLSQIRTQKGLLVIFSCNTCPYVKLSEGRIREYTSSAMAAGIGCVLVNSNEALRNEDDSFEEMVKYHAAQQLKAYYVVDEKSRLADAFGAGRTPQCFLFSANGLIYRGAIDDNVKDPAAVKNAWLKDALAALSRNAKPAVQETKSIGCTIKRAE